MTHCAPTHPPTPCVSPHFLQAMLVVVLLLSWLLPTLKEKAKRVSYTLSGRRRRKVSVQQCNPLNGFLRTLLVIFVSQYSHTAALAGLTVYWNAYVYCVSKLETRMWSRPW